MLHYGVWILALPLLGNGFLTVKSKGFSRNAALIIGAVAVVILWFGFAADYTTKGIRVNAIAPYADSPANQLAQSLQPDATASRGGPTRPIGRAGDCELDIGRTVVYLASELSAFVTGHTVMVDGGSCRF